MPIISGKRLDFRKNCLHCRRIAIRAATPVIRFKITFEKHTFYAIYSFNIAVKVIKTLFKPHIINDQKKGRHPKSQTDDVDQGGCFVFLNVSVCNLQKVAEHKLDFVTAKILEGNLHGIRQ